MYGKNKYYIMLKKLNATRLTAGKLVIKLLLLKNKVKKGKISQEQAMAEAGNIMSVALELMKKTAHIVYENCKDMKNIDEQELSRCLQKKGINEEKFLRNHYGAKKHSEQLLLILALLDRDFDETLDVEKQEMLYSQILNHELTNTDDSFYELSPDTKNIITSILRDEDIEVNGLGEEYIQLLKNYHNKYMAQYIYPEVTDYDVPDELIIKVSTKTLKKM